MKHFLCGVLFLSGTFLFGQVNFQADTTANKNNFLVVGNFYLYNIFIGQKKMEVFPGSSSSVYLMSEYKNTSGAQTNVSMRHFYTKKISFQLGLSFSYMSMKSIHNDSLKNLNNSNLAYNRNSELVFNFSYYFNYHFNNATLLSGIICPIVLYKCESKVYNDKTKERINKGFEFGNLYLSENIQFVLIKKRNIFINLGISLSPTIFDKYSNGYKMYLSTGIIEVIGKGKAHRKTEPKYFK